MALMQSTGFQRNTVYSAFGLTVLVFLGLLLGSAKPVEALPTVKIRDCYDGDTCTTSTGEKIRLACIDTPELRGKRAKPAPAMAAKYHLNGMVMNQTVGIRRIKKDRYGRTVAELFLNGTNVQQSMVASGHAEIYWKYAHQCPWTR